MKHNDLMRRKIESALTKYFGVNDPDGTYFYELARVKTADLSLDDFQGFTHIDVEDIVDEVMDAINKREQNDTQTIEKPVKTPQSPIAKLKHTAAIPLRDGAGI